MAVPLDDDLSGDFRAAMRRLASAVAIVTGRGLDGPVGIAATSVTSVTLDPPSVLVCVNRSTGLHACLAPGVPLAINILSRHQREISAAFGGAMPRERRFEFGRWEEDSRGLPMLAEAQANLQCTAHTLTVFGTHSVVIASVDAVRVSDTVAPLIYQDGHYL